MGLGASVAAVAHGATVIEKHFTLHREDGGVDSAFSLEPDEMKSLVLGTGRAWRPLGAVVYGSTADEEKSKRYRRSLYVSSDMKNGDLFTPENTKIVRPGLGLPPKDVDRIIGRKASQDVKKGTPTTWSIVN
jgi:sialic acid synthase SpsE